MYSLTLNKLLGLCATGTTVPAARHGGAKAKPLLPIARGVCVAEVLWGSVVPVCWWHGRGGECSEAGEGRQGWGAAWRGRISAAHTHVRSYPHHSYIAGVDPRRPLSHQEAYAAVHKNTSERSPACHYIHHHWMQRTFHQQGCISASDRR